jgi:superfamily II DNA or RNA helicase
MGSENDPYQTSIAVSQGRIVSSQCSCPAHGVYDTHCKHVAALTHWVMKTNGHNEADLDLHGTLRSPVAQGGAAPQNSAVPNGRHHMNGQQSRLPHPNNKQKGRNKQPRPQRPTEPLKATPIAYVKPVMEGEKQVGITIEPGLRVKNEQGRERVWVMPQLRHDNRSGMWIAPDKRRLVPLHDRVPILGALNASKTVYTGSTSVHMMSTLMSSSQAAQIVFDDSLKLDVSMDPLRVGTAVLGPRIGGGKWRELSFDLKNDAVSISADELKALASEGRVSGNFAWLGSKLYTFNRSLDWIEAHASVDGEVLTPRGTNPVYPSDLFPLVLDDEGRPLHPITAFRIGLEIGAQKFEVDSQWVEYHQWLKNFDRSNIPALPRVSYGFDLREYQANGLQWLWSLYHRGLGALLADDMGLGKTHQALALLSSLYKSKKFKPDLPSLVVAPTSVVSAWAQKLSKYKTGLKWSIFHGKERKIPSSGNDLILTTYGILQRDNALLKQAWHMVMLDESQLIKNPQTVSAQKARSLQAKFKIAMTGTPIENSMMDLWSIMEFLLPGYLGSAERFKRLYIPREGMPSPDQASTVRRLVAPFLLRRTKGQVLQELPEKIEEVRSCQLTEPQRERYNEFLRTKEAEALRAGLRGNGKIDYVGILAILTRLKQVCDHPMLPEVTSGALAVNKVDFDQSGKWDMFTEILEEALGSGLKVVVFTQYLSVLDLMVRYAKERGVGYAELRGDTSNRGEQLRRFHEEDQCKVFFCSLLAGGMGIDLTAASVCIHFDRWWNPAKENQATDRLHRIGQTRGVQVFKLQIPGTIEERIASIIESKTALADALIEESAVGLKTFSRQELLELLTEIPATEDETVAPSNGGVAVETSASDS